MCNLNKGIKEKRLECKGNRREHLHSDLRDQHASQVFERYLSSKKTCYSCS